jgi:multicomponent Na+:H+ antiporter subunit E
MMAYVRTTVIAMLIYLALTMNLEISNIVVALLIGIGVSLFIKPGHINVSISQLPRSIVTFFVYVVLLILDVIRSGINVARIVLDPKLPIRPGVVAIKSGTKNELGTALSAHAITITPGEMVIEIGDDGTMYTHCLDAVVSGAGADAAQAKRREMLEKIFN